MPHKSSVMPLRLRSGAESIAVKVPAQLTERQADMGLLDLVLLCGRRSWRRLVGLLLFCFFLLLPLARRVVRGLTVAFLSFLTTSVDAPGEQSTSRCLRVREHLSLSGAAQVQEPKTPLTLARFNYRFKTFKMSRFVGTFKTYTVLTQVYSRAAVPLPLLVEYRPTFTPPSHPIIMCLRCSRSTVSLGRAFTCLSITYTYVCIGCIG